MTRSSFIMLMECLQSRSDRIRPFDKVEKELHFLFSIKANYARFYVKITFATEFYILNQNSSVS